MELARAWCMPNKETFKIKPIKDLLMEQITPGIWVDPFARNSRYANITNDINPIYKTDYNLESLQFLSLFEDDFADGALLDWPYSNRQLSECYKVLGIKVTQDLTSAKWWADRKDAVSRIIKPGGKVITFGWNSQGLGQKRGFEIVKVLMVAHGGCHNDTIVTVERKIDISATEIKEELNNGKY